MFVEKHGQKYLNTMLAFTLNIICWRNVTVGFKWTEAREWFNEHWNKLKWKKAIIWPKPSRNNLAGCIQNKYGHKISVNKRQEFLLFY